jgi:RHS repeat-associated protein
MSFWSTSQGGSWSEVYGDAIFGIGGDTGVTYDTQGNLTSLAAVPAIDQPAENYRWNALGQMTSATNDRMGGATITYEYDAFGRRVRETNGGTSTFYLWDGDALLATGTGDDFTTAQVRVGFGPNDTRMLVGQLGNGAVTFVHPGTDGSALAATDGNGNLAEGYRYSSYGRTTFLDTTGAPTASQQSVTGNRFLFQGQLYDAQLGLYDMRAREYKPSWGAVGPWGRFLSRDPIGSAGGPNQYAFVGGQPLTMMDPSGMDEESSWSSWFEVARAALTPGTPMLANGLRADGLLKLWAGPVAQEWAHGASGALTGSSGSYSDINTAAYFKAGTEADAAAEALRQAGVQEADIWAHPDGPGSIWASASFGRAYQQGAMGGQIEPRIDPAMPVTSYTQGKTYAEWVKSRVLTQNELPGFVLGQVANTVAGTLGALNGINTIRSMSAGDAPSDIAVKAFVGTGESVSSFTSVVGGLFGGNTAMNVAARNASGVFGLLSVEYQGLQEYERMFLGNQQTLNWMQQATPGEFLAALKSPGGIPIWTPSGVMRVRSKDCR